MAIKIKKRIINKELVFNIKSLAETGFYDGTGYSPYLQDCTHQVESMGVTIIFTRDQLHHLSGWWKNPDYERCYHLSLSFFKPGDLFGRRPKDKKLTLMMLEAFYGDNKRLLWCEPPHYPEGKSFDVWHYRLFCDVNWQPIKPRGEVYNTKFTEIGWKSFSELNEGKHPGINCPWK